MLAGIYYGSIVTSIDGYEMAKQGRAGAALGISAVGSFARQAFVDKVDPVFQGRWQLDMTVRPSG